MTKEEEKAKEDLSFFNEGDYITKDMANSARVLEEYIKQLEQKETILDKVTEFIKEDVTKEDIKFEGSKIFHFVYKNLIDITKEKIAEGVNSYRREILNIIEGEKKK